MTLRMTEAEVAAHNARVRAGKGSPSAETPATGQIRASNDGMNGTERAYAQHLEHAKRAGEIKDYKFEAIKLRLARKTTYTPDFLVVYPDNSIQLHETKGFWRDDARVKIKVAAEMFPCFIFYAVQKVKGGWKWERICR